MPLIAKPHPVLASFAAAAVGLLPVMVMAVFELNASAAGVIDPSQVDDAGFRSAGLALVAAPFLYIGAVPVCYAFGVLLTSLGLRRLVGFLAGTGIVAVLLGLGAGLVLGAPSRFGFSDIALSVAVCAMVFLIAALPAALSWWFIAVQPHNRLLVTDARHQVAASRRLP